MITYGFFNSLNGDRVYNADQMSLYFKGLVADTGIYANVGGGLQVLADSGLSVAVQTGRALISSRWVEIDAVEPVSINTPHVTLNRYTAIVLELNATNREITLKAVDGENATNPIKPAIVRTTTIKQLCLAYVYVPAGATAITQANITDTRQDTSICGWITGLINQVDTSTLFLQWQSAYEQYFAQMESWKATQQASFDEWFAALTDELQVNTYIEQYDKQVTLTASSSRDVVLDIAGYSFDESDVFIIAFNGLVAEAGTDYMISHSISENTTYLHIESQTFSGVVDVRVLKSRIGWT